MEGKKTKFRYAFSRRGYAFSRQVYDCLGEPTILKIKFISSSLRVMFFLLYRQKNIDKILDGNYRNSVIDKLTCDYEK